MDTTHFLIFALATWRLSSLLYDEVGPFRLFTWIRTLAKIEHDEEGLPVVYPLNFAAQALSCMYCTSVWVGIFFVVAWLALPIPTIYLSYVLGLSAIAILIDKIV